MRRHMGFLFLTGFILVAALLPVVVFGEGNGVIHGLIYVSPHGDLSYDVMFGREEEVLLLNGDTDLEEELQALKGHWLPKLHEQDRAVYRARREIEVRRPNETARDRRREIDTFQLALKALEEARVEYRKTVDTLIAKNVLHKTMTDQEGKFRFEGLSAKRYFLHARFEVIGTTILYTWLYPVELKDGEEREVHLNKDAAIRLY